MTAAYVPQFVPAFLSGILHKAISTVEDCYLYSGNLSVQGIQVQCREYKLEYI